MQNYHLIYQSETHAIFLLKPAKHGRKVKILTNDVCLHSYGNYIGKDKTSITREIVKKRLCDPFCLMFVSIIDRNKSFIFCNTFTLTSFLNFYRCVAWRQNVQIQKWLEAQINSTEIYTIVKISFAKECPTGRFFC